MHFFRLYQQTQESAADRELYENIRTLREENNRLLAELSRLRTEQAPPPPYEEPSENQS